MEQAKKKSPRLLRLQDYELNFDLMSKDALNRFQDDIAEFFELEGKIVSRLISVETARAEISHVVGDLGFALAVPMPNQPDSVGTNTENFENETPGAAINASQSPHS